MLKNLKPLFFENSFVPKLLSKFAPIRINAVSFFIFVFGRDKLTEMTKTHETIHFQQQLELLFVGQWILYVYYYLRNRLKVNSAMAYYLNPFELEAYAGQATENYLETRKRYAWWKFRKQYKTGGHSKKPKK
tara:strand:- start:17428 stop:17823 length:396 start_codon:yes stop_codon:yes gene_type:complete